MRVATVDIGTNTVLLLVAEQRPDGSLVAVRELAAITRLGEGVDRTKRLSPEAVARTQACLEGYAETARTLGAERIAVVGTSAMRDAAGVDVLRAFVHAKFGVDARVVSGQDEARLTFRGALSGLSLDECAQMVVFDIGGGSTEVVTGRMGPFGPELDYAESFDVGSVRLTERYIAHDPPTTAERARVDGRLREIFVGVPALAPGRTPVGIAGTITTLAAISLGIVPYDGGRVHGSILQTDEIRRIVDRLAGMPLAERRLVPGIEPKRADVIVAGGSIALRLLEHWRAPRLIVSDRGVRWGLAEELLVS